MGWLVLEGHYLAFAVDSSVGICEVVSIVFFYCEQTWNVFLYLVRFPDKRSLARNRSCLSSPNSSNFAVHFHYIRSIKSAVMLGLQVNMP